jgi:sporulation protein YlmC with PRC-barrel domain
VKGQHLLDNLRHGASVYSSDEKKVGTLHAVVLDPSDNEITHIVVNVGPHFPEPGFGAPDLVNVPIAQMEDAGEEHVYLKCGAAEFKDFPPYEEYSFTETEAAEGTEEPHRGPLRKLWDVGVALAYSFGNVGTGIAIPAEKFRKASYERHIVNDTPVWRTEPHELIGEVERVLASEQTGEIEALVIKRGTLFHEEVVLPISHVTEIQDGIIHASLTDDELKSLQKYGG